MLLRRRLIPRVVAAVAAATLSAAALAGCTPGDPAPSPTATGFATEAEAFAAAEATYRAYVDALNQVDLSDPATFEDVYRWTTGDANAGERESLTGMHADGWVVSGESLVVGFFPQGWDEAMGTVSSIACVDVSLVAVRDADGKSVVPTDRPATYALALDFSPHPSTPTGLAIDQSNAVEDPLCDS